MFCKCKFLVYSIGYVISCIDSMPLNLYNFPSRGLLYLWVLLRFEQTWICFAVVESRSPKSCWKWHYMSNVLNIGLMPLNHEWIFCKLRWNWVALTDRMIVKHNLKGARLLLPGPPWFVYRCCIHRLSQRVMYNACTKKVLINLVADNALYYVRILQKVNDGFWLTEMTYRGWIARTQ